MSMIHETKTLRDTTYYQTSSIYLLLETQQHNNTTTYSSTSVRYLVDSHFIEIVLNIYKWLDQEMYHLLLLVAFLAGIASSLPVGGRFDVHGWLILPQEQLQKDNASYAIRAWFSHHVPEFWRDSPHNFQIILEGLIFPETSVPGYAPLPLNLPMPPENDLEIYEYSFTPPSPFSLNDLIDGRIQQLRGMFYNGSFDTPYERIPQSLALLQVTSLTTVIYLSESETNGYANLRYLAYPRNKDPKSGSKHFYLAHEIHAQPDFDHVVHGTIDGCDDANLDLIYAPGNSLVPYFNNNIIEEWIKKIFF